MQKTITCQHKQTLSTHTSLFGGGLEPQQATCLCLYSLDTLTQIGANPAHTHKYQFFCQRQYIDNFTIYIRLLQTNRVVATLLTTVLHLLAILMTWSPPWCGDCVTMSVSV